MQKIKTFLSYAEGAEEAVNLYVSLFPNSRITATTRYGDAGPGPKGSVMTVAFELDGREYVALNGGPHFTFTDGVSLLVTCETQEELDRYWAKLSEGGQEVQCGWLKDRFGLSWQVVPSALGQYLSDPDRERSGRVFAALMKMKKLDIAGLKRAYEGR
ncbi:MAG TPA: VOC family protein [Anaeromyxobacteraceae bacterium]|nr:VOC family protein [Anaeromyxobacteraceae bacterium]